MEYPVIIKKSSNRKQFNDQGRANNLLGERKAGHKRVVGVMKIYKANK